MPTQKTPTLLPDEAKALKYRHARALEAIEQASPEERITILSHVVWPSEAVERAAQSESLANPTHAARSGGTPSPRR